VPRTFSGPSSKFHIIRLVIACPCMSALAGRNEPKKEDGVWIAIRARPVASPWPPSATNPEVIASRTRTLGLYPARFSRPCARNPLDTQFQTNLCLSRCKQASALLITRHNFAASSCRGISQISAAAAKPRAHPSCLAGNKGSRPCLIATKSRVFQGVLAGTACARPRARAAEPDGPSLAAAYLPISSNWNVLGTGRGRGCGSFALGGTGVFSDVPIVKM
jgi:hypothetical protein